MNELFINSSIFLALFQRILFSHHAIIGIEMVECLIFHKVMKNIISSRETKKGV